jgi:hypothetical protein
MQKEFQREEDEIHLKIRKDHVSIENLQKDFDDIKEVPFGCLALNVKYQLIIVNESYSLL